MDSYPNEFTAHHLPLLFVAGLGTTSQSLPNQQDPFHHLVQHLRDSLTINTVRGYALWDNTRGVNNDFRAALVEKVRPPRPLTHPRLIILHS